jgi:hypothetical protein
LHPAPPPLKSSQKVLVAVPHVFGTHLSYIWFKTLEAASQAVQPFAESLKQSSQPVTQVFDSGVPLLVKTTTSLAGGLFLEQCPSFQVVFASHSKHL